MFFPYIVPFVFPVSLLAAMIGLLIIEPHKKWERAILFVPYLNVLYVLLFGINKAIQYIREGR